MEASVLIDKVKAVIDPLLAEDQSYFCVQIKVKPTNNIKVFLDGDNGLPIERCTFFNRKLYKAIEEEAWFPEGDFSLEVSTPDISHPLKVKRQYIKNINRILKVKTSEEDLEGVLAEADEDKIVLNWKAREPKPIGKGKVTVQKTATISYKDIKEAKVKIVF